MSIFNKIFGGADQQVTQQQQAATITPAVAANPTVPSGATVPAGANPDGSTPSPMDSYKELWSNDPNAKAPMAEFSFNPDQAKLMEAAKSVDFTRVVTPELSKRIMAGGSDGMTAVMEAMN